MNEAPDRRPVDYLEAEIEKVQDKLDAEVRMPDYRV
jgi:hypothetical protein